jgi:hypothetical protein
MKNLLLLILTILITPSLGFGQSGSLTVDDSIHHQYYIKKDLTLITGYQIQKNHFAEIGIGIMKDGVVGHHPSTLIYGISNELKISNDFVWGLKAGLWLGGGVAGMNLGLNLINYTDFNENSLRFRPEIGMGFGVFRIVYGYNLAITNKNFVGINKHNFGLNIMLKLKTLIEERR